MIEYKALEEEVWILTAEGQSILKEGSHEVKVFNFIPAGEEGCTVASIKVQLAGPVSSFLTLIRMLWVNRVKLVKAKLSRTSGLG